MGIFTGALNLPIILIKESLCLVYLEQRKIVGRKSLNSFRYLNSSAIFSLQKKIIEIETAFSFVIKSKMHQ